MMSVMGEMININRHAHLRRPVTTLWQALINYINRIYSINSGVTNHIFSRQRMFAELEHQGFRIKRNTYNTADQYRNTLRAAGYIKTISRGMYEIFGEIPCDLSIQDARNMASERVRNERHESGIQPIRRFYINGIGKTKKKNDFIKEGEFQV